MSKTKKPPNKQNQPEVRRDKPADVAGKPRIAVVAKRHRSTQLPKNAGSAARGPRAAQSGQGDISPGYPRRKHGERRGVVVITISNDAEVPPVVH